MTPAAEPPLPLCGCPLRGRGKRERTGSPAPSRSGWREAPGWFRNALPGSPSDGQQARIPRPCGATPFSEKGVGGMRLRRFAPHFKNCAAKRRKTFFTPFGAKGAGGIRAPVPAARAILNRGEAATFFAPSSRGVQGGNEPGMTVPSKIPQKNTCHFQTPAVE